MWIGNKFYGDNPSLEDLELMIEFETINYQSLSNEYKHIKEYIWVNGGIILALIVNAIFINPLRSEVISTIYVFIFLIVIWPLLFNLVKYSIKLILANENSLSLWVASKKNTVILQYQIIESATRLNKLEERYNKMLHGEGTDEQ